MIFIRCLRELSKAAQVLAIWYLPLYLSRFYSEPRFLWLIVLSAVSTFFIHAHYEVIDRFPDVYNNCTFNGSDREEDGNGE